MTLHRLKWNSDSFSYFEYTLILQHDSQKNAQMDWTKNHQVISANSVAYQAVLPDQRERGLYLVSNPSKEFVDFYLQFI